MNSSFKSVFIQSLASLGILLLAACGPGPGGKQNKEKEETTPVPVETTSVQLGDVVAVYSGTTTLEAEEDAQVVAKVGGEIVAIEVEEGDQVKAGQVLARLDGDRLRLELERSKANLQKLEQEYKRNLDLYEKGLVSSGAYEGLKFELDALKSAFRLAQLELNYTVIRAPIDGVISQRQVKVGNTITANTPLFRIVDLDPLLAYLYVPEREFRKLIAEQQAMVQVDALPGRQFQARIARISPVIDANSGTFKVTLEVVDTTRSLKPGMFGRFNIVYDKHENTLLIPRSALLRDDDETAVFLVKDDIAERRVVTTGYSQGGQLEILSGLAQGDSIVIVGQAGLSNGNPVRVVNADTGPEREAEPESTETALASDS